MNLLGVDLREANLGGASLADARHDGSTLWPEAGALPEDPERDPGGSKNE